MSRTNREIVQALRGVLAERGVISDSSDLSNRLVLYYANKSRSAVLKSKIEDKRSRVSHFNKQTIPCIPMEKIDINECPCAPPSGCFFYRSVIPIPNPLTRYLEVDNIIGNKNIAFLEWGEFRNKLNSRMNAERTDPYWTIRTMNGKTYLYLYNYPEKFVTVTSVWEDPLEVQLYPDCAGNVDPCKQYLDLEFIIDDAFVPLVIEASYRMLVERVKEGDSTINQKDDTTKQIVPAK